jgi:hypothetical protein
MTRMVALCSVLALSTSLSAAPCRLALEHPHAPHSLWKGTIGTREVVTLQAFGVRGVAGHRGGGAFWTGAICTASRSRSIGSLLLRLPDEISASVSGSLLIALRRHEALNCDVSQLTNARLADQVIGKAITGTCADGRPVALVVRGFWP